MCQRPTGHVAAGSEGAGISNIAQLGNTGKKGAWTE